MTSDEIRKYMERAFAMDCPQMILRQNVDSGGRTYEGPGTIYQTKEGELSFKLYAGGKPDTGLLARFFGPGALKSGEIIPRSEYFTLEASSLTGALWRCDLVLPEFNQGVLGGPVATGSLYELVKNTNDPDQKNHPAYLSLSFPRDFDFPGNVPRTTRTYVKGVETGWSGDWTTAAFEAAGIAVELQKIHGSVFLAAQSKDRLLPRHLDLRICEALEFTFFQHERWVIRVIAESEQYSTTLRPFPKPSKKSSWPPLKFTGVLSSGEVWILFGKYLEYVLPYEKPKWHSLSENVHLAVTADSSSLESRLLGLSVAVEGMLNTGFPSLATVDDSLRDEIVSACKLISESGLLDSFKRRVAGALGAMQIPRATDKLRVFAEADVTRRELVDAWSGMRNSAVHASELDPAEIRTVFRDYQSALTLLNELVMLLIGYRGQYTDYSVPGWPQREWKKSLKGLEIAAPLSGAAANGDADGLKSMTSTP